MRRAPGGREGASLHPAASAVNHPSECRHHAGECPGTMTYPTMTNCACPRPGSSGGGRVPSRAAAAAAP
eukprot:2582950-Alexandrium_andersonii.AAC.1